MLGLESKSDQSKDKYIYSTHSRKNVLSAYCVRHCGRLDAGDTKINPYIHLPQDLKRKAACEKFMGKLP